MAPKTKPVAETTTEVSPQTVILNGITYVQNIKPITDGSLTLNPSQLTELSQLAGGRALKSGDDVVKLMKSTLQVSVNGVKLELTPEDAQTLQDQFIGTFDKFMTFDEYLNASIQDALSLFLWGSTTGKLAYK